MFTYNPLKWKSLTNIEIKGAEVDVLCDVTPTSQAVTTKEEQLWENFISNYQQAIKSNFNYHTVNKELLRETQSDSRKHVKYALIGGVIAGVPAGFIAYYTGVDSIVGIAAAGGGFYYMRHQIEKEKSHITQCMLNLHLRFRLRMHAAVAPHSSPTGSPSQCPKTLV